MDNIKRIINKHLELANAHIGIGFKNLKTEEEFYVNGYETFPTASVFKILVLIELFSQKLNKQINFDARYKYMQEERSLGYGILSQLSETIELTYKDYITLMMTISDNTATDILIRKVGMEKIELLIKHLRLENTRVDLLCDELLTGLYEIVKSNSYEEKLQKINKKRIKKDCTILVDCDVENNITTPRDIVNILSMIYYNEILDECACRDILNIMKACQTNSRIPRYLPEFVDIAHKTGTLDRVANDVGIIYNDNSDYILAVFYNGNLVSDEEYNKNIKGTIGDQFIANLSKELYDYISNKDK